MSEAGPGRNWEKSNWDDLFCWQLAKPVVDLGTFFYTFVCWNVFRLTSEENNFFEKEDFC